MKFLKHVPSRGAFLLAYYTIPKTKRGYVAYQLNEGIKKVEHYDDFSIVRLERVNVSVPDWMMSYIVVFDHRCRLCHHQLIDKCNLKFLDFTRACESCEDKAADFRDNVH